MYRTPGLVRLAPALLLTVCFANNASAQQGVYVQGTVFADIRQFGTTGAIQSAISDFSLDATGIGGSARVGTWLDRRWTLEAGFEMGNRTTVEIENPYILALFPPGMRPRDLEASTSFTSVTPMIGFHQRANRRVRFGYRAGFSFVRATFRSQLPVGITRSPVVERQNTGALALGFETAISLRRHLSVVPELRALAFSLSGRGQTFLIRPGVGARWNF
jgi:hypothetical protein